MESSILLFRSFSRAASSCSVIATLYLFIIVLFAAIYTYRHVYNLYGYTY